MRPDESESPGFEIRTESLGDATVVVLSGEMDIVEAPPVILRLRELLARGKGPVILDVHDLTYIDSVGLSVLLSTSTHLQREGRTLSAVGSHGIFKRILHVSQMDRQIPCYSTVEEALSASVEV